MVALLPASAPKKHKAVVDEKPECENRVVSVLMRRLGSSRTFGENLIFMLNRAGDHLFFCLIHTLQRVDVRP